MRVPRDVVSRVTDCRTTKRNSRTPFTPTLDGTCRTKKQEDHHCVNNARRAVLTNEKKKKIPKINFAKENPSQASPWRRHGVKSKPRGLTPASLPRNGIGTGASLQATGKFPTALPYFHQRTHRKSAVKELVSDDQPSTSFEQLTNIFTHSLVTEHGSVHGLECHQFFR